MLDAVPAELVGSVFCDSLEVYGADWTARLPDEFARRRGYDLLPLLHLLVVDEPDSTRIRADYHRTLAELCEENFIAVCRGWAAGEACRSGSRRTEPHPRRSAATGSRTCSRARAGAGAISPQTRWASSAAHLYGRPVVSAEAWTWVHSPSFRATPLDLKGEAHEHFLNGVNQLVGHGWPYSPADAPGLGWFFYAAGALDDRNPWWPAMPELTRYLSRLCWLLRQGEAVADVALYLPNEDLYATMGRAQGGSLDTWREARRRIPSWIPGAIRTAGLDYDLVDDDALAVTAPERYRVVVVPAATSIPAATADWFTRVRESGGTVIDDGLADALAAAIEPDVAISPRSEKIGFVHRRGGDLDLYLVVNTGPTTSTFGMVARTDRASYEQWDPMTGHVLRVGATTDGIELTLQPYEAAVLVLSDDLARRETSPIAHLRRAEAATCRSPVTGAWRTATNQPSRSSCRTSGRTSRAAGTTRAQRRTRGPSISAPFPAGRRSTSGTARSTKTERPSRAWSALPTEWGYADRSARWPGFG